jgi:hypothetical protein
MRRNPALTGPRRLRVSATDGEQRAADNGDKDEDYLLHARVV